MDIIINNHNQESSMGIYVIRSVALGIATYFAYSVNPKLAVALVVLAFTEFTIYNLKIIATRKRVQDLNNTLKSMGFSDEGNGVYKSAKSKDDSKIN